MLFQRNSGVRCGGTSVAVLAVNAARATGADWAAQKLPSSEENGTVGEYRFYHEFQSHEPEFDYLKSLEIEEKVNKIKWFRRHNASLTMLSTNGLRVGATGAAADAAGAGLTHVRGAALCHCRGARQNRQVVEDIRA